MQLRNQFSKVLSPGSSVLLANRAWIRTVVKARHYPIFPQDVISILALLITKQLGDEYSIQVVSCSKTKYRTLRRHIYCILNMGEKRFERVELCQQNVLQFFRPIPDPFVAVFPISKVHLPHFVDILFHKLDEFYIFSNTLGKGGILYAPRPAHARQYERLSPSRLIIRSSPSPASSVSGCNSREMAPS